MKERAVGGRVGLAREDGYCAAGTGAAFLRDFLAGAGVADGAAAGEAAGAAVAGSSFGPTFTLNAS